MQFSLATLVGALAAAASAKPVITNSGFDVQAGKPFTLTWTSAIGAVEIQLVTGDAKNLKPVGSPIATGITDSQFVWTPPASLPSGTYAFQVKDTVEPNWSLQWSFQGSASASVSSSVASTSTGSSTRSSTSSAPSTTSSASSSSVTTITSSAFTNGTTTTGTRTSSTTTSTRAATTTPVNSNNGQRFSSSLALVLVTVAALVCFN